MKIGRSKQIKKQLQLLDQLFKIKAPYKILIDGSFLSSWRLQRLPESHFSTFFKAPCNIMITSCCLKELKLVAASNPKAEYLHEAVKLATQMKVVKCSCAPDTSASNCILSQIGPKNSQKYFVATQDKKLRKDLSKVSSCLTIFVTRGNVLLLDEQSLFQGKTEQKDDKKVARGENNE